MIIQLTGKRFLGSLTFAFLLGLVCGMKLSKYLRKIAKRRIEETKKAYQRKVDAAQIIHDSL